MLDSSNSVWDELCQSQASSCHDLFSSARWKCTYMLPAILRMTESYPGWPLSLEYNYLRKSINFLHPSAV